MKKITVLFVSLFLIISLNSCNGYKPIFSSAKFKFEIADYSIVGDKKLGNMIFSKLNNISRLNKNDPDKESITITIDVTKNKNATVKNSAGKVLEYKINLNTNIIVRDYLTNKEKINQNFDYSSSYKVQDQHSETVKSENTTVENLVEKTYQDLLIKISESVVK